MTNQDLLYFWLSLRNVTLPHRTSNYVYIYIYIYIYSWVNPCTNCIFVTSPKLLVSIALKSRFSTRNWWSENEYKNKANTYQVWSLMIIHLSFIRNVWIGATPSASVTLPFTYPHILTLLTSNSLLSMMIPSLASIIQLSVTYPLVPDEAQKNNHQDSYLLSIRLILVLSHLNYCLSGLYFVFEHHY